MKLNIKLVTAIDREDIRLRKAFLGLTSRDEAVLRRHSHRLANHASGFVRRFYQHLERFVPLKPVLARPQGTQRLREIQARYFRSLLKDRCDNDYVQSRLRIGTVHHHIGLALKWYTGAYALYLVHLVPLLWEDPELDHDACAALTQALIRRVFFDMGLAIDTYVDADQRRIDALRAYAERIIDSAPCGLAVTDTRLRILSLNPRFTRLLELSEDHDKSLETLLPISGLRQLASKVLQDRAERAFNFEQRRNGWRRLYRVNIAPIELGDLAGPERWGLIFSLEDYTEQDRLRLLSAQREARLQAIMASMPDGIVVFAADGTIESWNRATEKLLCYRGDELSRSNISRLLRQQAQPISAERLAQHLWHQQRKRLEVFGVRKDGALLPLEVAIERIGHSDPPLYLAILHDVSARKEAEAELDRMARFDSLTNLPNRSLYLDRLRVELLRARRYQQQLAVMFLDLDDFKKINDSLGHLAGDLLLQEVGHRLTATLRESDTVARFGGDEFTFIIPDLSAPHAWRDIATKILATFKQPFYLEGREVFVKASIGVSLFPQHSSDPHTLLRYADAAMYRAKFRGRNQVCCYDHTLENETTERMVMESELHRALERGELQLVYQPKVATASRRITGMEALLRWHNPRLGRVAPDRFIPMLEEVGLIQEVGRWMLRTALDQALRWHRHCGRPLEIAVNISSRQIDEESFATEVMKLLEEIGFPPHCLELEITESILMEGTEVTHRNISQLRRKGVRFAIDDFGTGYSSLSYLRNFSFDTLKIDRSFIQNLDNPRDLALAGHIVAIGHSLDLAVVAEGVEKEAQLQAVTRLGCDLVQGYLLYRPLDVGAMTAVLGQAGRLD